MVKSEVKRSINETGLRGKTIPALRQTEYEERLVFMRGLAPGDFAAVKRHCVLLGEDLSPEEWLAQLKLEVLAKKRSVDEGAKAQVA